MAKRIFLGVILCIGMITLNGCWDAHDVETLSLPIAAAFDRHQPRSEEGVKPMYDITSLSPNFSTEAPKKYAAETITAPIIGEVRNKRHFESPYRYVVGMLQLVIFGEDVARLGLVSVTDILFRSPQISDSIFLAVVEGRGDEMLKTPIEDFPNMGVYLMDLLRNAGKNTFMVTTNLHQMAEGSLIPGRNAVLPLLKLQDKKAVLAGTAIFNKGRMIAKIDQEETRTLIFLREPKSTGYMGYTINQEGDTLDQGSIYAHASRKVKVQRQDDHFVFTVQISLQGSLIERFKKESLLEKPEALKEIEDQMALDIKKECEAFINKMQNEYKVDCIDINKYALARWRKELTPVIDSGFIENAEIRVKVKVKIISTGDVD